MSRKLTKPIIAILMIGVLAIGVAGFAVADGGSFFFVGSTNTVTQVNYPTTTATTTLTTTGVTTVTGTPYQTLTTVTASGTQTYTATVTQTTGVVTTSTATANEEYYNPLAMYYVWSNNTGFYRQLVPWSATSTSTSDTVTESVAGDGAVTMAINQVSGGYNDLGYYYVYQNLSPAWLATSGDSITVSGTGTFAINLWINPGNWGWGPTSVPGIEVYTSGTGTYGLGTTSGTTQTITYNTQFQSWQGAGLISCNGSFTPSSASIADVTADCTGVTSFALWVGVGPISPGTVSATIDATYSTP